MANWTASTSVTGCVCDAGDDVARCETGPRCGAAGENLNKCEPRTGCHSAYPRQLAEAEGDSQHAVLDFAALLERVDDAAGGCVDWNRVAGRLLVAGDRGGGRGEPDQLATEIQQCAAGGAEAELGVGLDERAQVMERGAIVAGWAGGVVEVRAAGCFAGEVGDDAPAGGRLAVGLDGVRVADGDDELAFAERLRRRRV